MNRIGEDWGHSRKARGAHPTPAAGVGSGDGVLRVLPHLRRAEAEHDVRLWNASLNELLGNAAQLQERLESAPGSG